jgi:hypothetical protein
MGGTGRRVLPATAIRLAGFVLWVRLAPGYRPDGDQYRQKPDL